MLDDLRKITQEVGAAQDLQSALNIIVERVQQVMGTQVCTVYLLDKDETHFLFMATKGLNQEAVGKVSIERSRGLVGLVGERAEPVNLDDAPKHPQYLYVEEVGEEPFHSFLGVPIIQNRRVLGVLVVQQKKRRRFDESEEGFLITLSGQLAHLIAHAKATGGLRQLQSDEHMPSRKFEGTPGAPGVAFGTVVVSFPQAELSTVPDRRVDDVQAELSAFQSALVATREEFIGLASKLSDRLQREEVALFDAYQHMLDDHALGGEVTALIEQGYWAQSALRMVIDEHVAKFESMDDAYLRERGSDFKDLGQRVLAKLQAISGKQLEYPDNTILVAEELTVALLGEIPEEKLVGLVSVRGSANSHVAILARGLGIATVMGAVDLPVGLIDGQPLIVDGFEGCVFLRPTKDQYAQYQKIIKDEERLVEVLDTLKLNDLPCETKDGHLVRLWVNTGLMTDVVRSLDRGATGVGLYRTEIQFLMNDRFPTEEEQRLVYREHLLAFSPLPVTMRTLDIGGDKSLAYFPIEEENPFLGWRGIRVTLDHPELFLAQVRAMIRANEGIEGHLRIMLPMVSCVTEVDEAQRLISQCYREIIEEGVEVEMPDVGVMIEVPAAVYQARDIVKRVDFLSVGSNDLTQYMLAVDRNNPQVASLYQDFHPAVLRALYDVVLAAHDERKPVAICGEIAGNPAATILLMAMGYDVLSMSSSNLRIIKWVVRSFEMVTAKKLLQDVLKMDNAYLIKNYMDQQLRNAGLVQLLHER